MERGIDPEDTVLEPGEVIGGRFVVDKIIGRGGFAEVYRVSDERGDAHALKLLRPQSARDKRTLARHVQEAMLLAAIDHPNIVRFDSRRPCRPRARRLRRPSRRARNEAPRLSPRARSARRRLRRARRAQRGGPSARGSTSTASTCTSSRSASPAARWRASP